MRTTWAIYAVIVLGVCLVIGMIVFPYFATRPLSKSELLHRAQAGSSRESTDPQAADLIAMVKDVSASRLDRGLPTVRFEDWVRGNAGPDWTITWHLNQGPKNAPNNLPDFPDTVDLRGDTKDGRYFRLSIGTSTNANQVLLFWLSGAANIQDKWVGLQHLSQWPRLLHHASQSSHSSEGHR